MPSAEERLAEVNDWIANLHIGTNVAPLQYLYWLRDALEAAEGERDEARHEVALLRKAMTGAADVLQKIVAASLAKEMPDEESL